MGTYSKQNGNGHTGPSSKQMEYLFKLSSETSNRAIDEHWTRQEVSQAIDALKASSNGNGYHAPEDIQPLEAFDLVDNLQEEFEPLQWIIPDYLPEGLTLLFSRPKVGKSMLALALSLRMARRVSGGVDGTVLYLTLDDTNKRRLQSRTRSLLQGEEIERDRVWASTQSQTLDSGLIGQLALWMKEHPTTRLMVIDVYARIKPKKQDDDVYKSDYNAIVQLQEFAVQHHIAILLVHHTRKQRDTEDWIDNVNGSTGLSAGVDTLWTLERVKGTNSLTLRVKGRDTMGELEVGLTLDDLDAPWQLKGEEDESDTNATEKRILDVLKSGKSGRVAENNTCHSATLATVEEAYTPKEICELTGLNPSTARKELRRMLHKNLVAQTTYGSYRITELQKDRGVILPNMAPQANPERITENYKSHKNGTNAILATLPSQDDNPFWSNEPVGQDAWYDAPPPEYTYEPPTSPGAEVLPRCPSCRHNKRVHHIQVNEYGCNSCGRKFYQ